MADSNEDSQFLDDDMEDEEEAEEETVESSDDAGSSDEGSKAEKRIRDLQSKADAAEARANKAEAALRTKVQGGSGAGSDPVTRALMTEVREASLDAVFAEFQQLRDYGIDRSLIEGSTRSELRENATSLVGLIKSVETKVTNRVLSDNGLQAAQTGNRVRKAVDYASMSDEDFEKALASVN